MQSVSGSTSTITGVALTDSAALALATNVMPGTITSSPSPIPHAISAASSVCAVLDQMEPALLAQRNEEVEVADGARDVHGDDRARLRRDRGLGGGHVDA